MEVFSNQYFVFFLIVALGLILGNITIKGVSLDISAVIFVAIIFGHFGYKTPVIIQQIGLILFIYSVGIQAGPGFFNSIKSQGRNYILLGAVVIGSGLLTTLASYYILGLDIALLTGMFTGALTSTPGLAAAIESTQSPLASIGYGIAYPFGVLGVILFVKIAPIIFRINTKQEEEKYESTIKAEFPKVFNRNYTVTNPSVFGKSLAELHFRSITMCNISRTLSDGVASTPNEETVLNEGDIIKAVGTENNLEKVKILIGPETTTKIPLGNKYIVKNVLVSNKEIVNKSFADVELLATYDATATRIRRAGIDIAAKANTKIQLGDKITIACPEANIGQVSKLFGDSSETLRQLDLLPISIGVLLGIVIGSLSIPLFGVEIKLGLTGGVLLSALILSKIGRTGPIIWNVSGTINQFLRKVGLVFFLLSVGTNAGENLLSTIKESGLELLITGAIITIIPMIITVLFGRYILKMNFLLLLGALTGGMTSTPALSALDTMAKSDAPKVAYATIYPFALVFVILASQLLGAL